ncbi:6-pyruvoyl trahydropterin synthase family protein [Thiocapsa rosea]|uniref:6-carboxy-5,6,7,8-tetrahydropterin synthase n=1 Tax=Thiocapsa rosea TaxID=69360 RepID=A0A495VCI6_9GAMM|nr:6-carboxytetrahydropterin synthase [Thiocapsa rosea]RKT47116.1 6-pyruvoyl tetrahydropterin synthase/QueD family protein [Thiocapsa rosea]
MSLPDSRADPAQSSPRHPPEPLGLTLQEQAIRRHLPLELLVDRSALTHRDRLGDYPSPGGFPSEAARAVLLGLRWAGLLREDADFVWIPGEIRRLELLLWDLSSLQDYGFRFRQDYVYAGSTHRVVALNGLKAPKANVEHFRSLGVCPIAPPDFLASLAVFLAHVGELHAGYLFLPFQRADQGRAVAVELTRHGIGFQELDAADEPQGLLLRSATLADARCLLDLLRDRLQPMPGALERFEQTTPEVTVSKELVFDAAHFITDHPAKCSNLHGGRYRLHVKVTGRIDPVTGCVVDYGYLKRVVSRRVVERFDHHTLNYCAPELAWRSSTELLCVYIWEQLIDYLPGLDELELYETPQSWCRYRGPTLEHLQRHGPDPVLTYFQQDLGSSPLRRQIQPLPVRDSGLER